MTKCEKCKGSTFKNLNMDRGSYVLECICGHVMRGKGGVYVDKITGQANMNM